MRTALLPQSPALNALVMASLGHANAYVSPFHWQTIKLIDSDSQRMLLHYLSKTQLDETIFLWHIWRS